MLYYVVTEGRANVLDRLNLRDRSTYGVDWMVFYATSARDAVRQWGLYKTGRHLRQAELELEAAQYRMATAGYAPAWEAEREAIAVEAAERLEDVESQQRALREAQADLDTVRKDLKRIAGRVPGRRRRRPAASTTRRRRRPTRRSGRARAARRGSAKARPTAKRRRARKPAGR